TIMTNDTILFPTRRSSDLAEQPEVRPRDAHHERKDDHADRRAEAELEHLEEAPVGVDRECLGGTRRTTAREHKHDIERAQRVERSEEHTSELQSPDHLVCR